MQARLEGIEWGADVHVPGGNLAAAAEVGTRSRDAGLAVVSYGTYYGMSADTPGIDTVLDTAEALGAPMVHVWTEFGVGPDAPAKDRDRVHDRTSAFAGRAANRGLAVALEFHPWCLTHTAQSTVALLQEIDAPNLFSHWQPDPALSALQALTELETVLPWLAHVHTFSWGAGGITERYDLATGEPLWLPALHLADGNRYALLEYVRDDDPAQLVRDAATLREWLTG